jgi:hypothetical protein
MSTSSKRSHFNTSSCISQCCSYFFTHGTRPSSSMLYTVKYTYVDAFRYIIFPTRCHSLLLRSLNAQPFAPRNLLQAVLLQVCLREVTCFNLGQEAECPSCFILWFPQDSNFFTLDDDPTLSRLACSFIYSLSFPTMTLRSMKYIQCHYVQQNI